MIQSASDLIYPDFPRRGAFVPRNRSANQNAPIAASRKNPPHERKVSVRFVSTTFSQGRRSGAVSVQFCRYPGVSPAAIFQVVRSKGRRFAIRRAVSLIRSSLQEQDRFKNLRRPDRKSPCCRGRTPWQRRRISSHDWNRTRAENPTHRNRYSVEFASAHLRL